MDDETVQISRQRNEVILRAFWVREDLWHSKLISLHELSWLSSGRTFAVVPEPFWHDDFLARWRAATGDKKRLGRASQSCSRLQKAAQISRARVPRRPPFSRFCASLRDSAAMHFEVALRLGGFSKGGSEEMERSEITLKFNDTNTRIVVARAIGEAELRADAPYRIVLGDETLNMENELLDLLLTFIKNGGLIATAAFIGLVRDIIKKAFPDAPAKPVVIVIGDKQAEISSNTTDEEVKKIARDLTSR